MQNGKVYVMTNSTELKEVGVFVVTNKSISVSAQMVTTLAETVIGPLKHGISINNPLDLFFPAEDMLIEMATCTDVSKYQLTQNSRSSCL